MINKHDIEAFERFQPPVQLELFQEDININYFDKVREFHTAFNHPFGLDFEKISPNEFWLRWRLIAEEFKELGLEFQKADEFIVAGAKVPEPIRVNILKETADLQ